MREAGLHAHSCMLVSYVILLLLLLSYTFFCCHKDVLCEFGLAAYPLNIKNAFMLVCCLG